MNSRNYVRVFPIGSPNPEELQTATVRFVDGTGGLAVDLVGCVHIGDAAYYEALNEQLSKYDAVLFELVADKERLDNLSSTAGKQSPSLVAMLQQFMSKFLGVVHQVDLIDYERENMVHADLSPGELAKAMDKRGLSVVSIVIEIAMEALRRMSKSAQSPVPSSLLPVLASQRLGARDLKVEMAQVLAEKTDGLSAVSPSLHELIICERNEAALAVLRREIASGKRSIAIFYGAGHGPDFEDRLRRDFGLTPTTETWATAWDMRPSA